MLKYVKKIALITLFSCFSLQGMKLTMQVVNVVEQAAKAAATATVKAAQAVTEIQLPSSVGNAANKFMVQPVHATCNSWFTTSAPANLQHIDPGLTIGKQVDQSTQQIQVGGNQELTIQASPQLHNICQMTNHVALTLEFAKNQPFMQHQLQKCVASASPDLANRVEQVPSRMVTFEEAYSVYKFRPALWQAWEAAASQKISCENIPVVESALSDINLGTLQKNSDLVASGISKLDKVCPHFEGKPFEGPVLSQRSPVELNLPPQATQPSAQATKNPAPSSHLPEVTQASRTITGDDLRRQAFLDEYHAQRWTKPNSQSNGHTVGSTQNWQAGAGVSFKCEGTLSELQKSKPKAPDQVVDHISCKVSSLLERFDTSNVPLRQFNQELQNARREAHTYKNICEANGSMSGEKQAGELIDRLDLLLTKIGGSEVTSFATTNSVPVDLCESDLTVQEQAGLYQEQQMYEKRALQDDAQINDQQQELQSYYHEKVVYDQAPFKFLKRWDGIDPEGITQKIKQYEAKIKWYQDEAGKCRQLAQVDARKMDAIKQRLVAECSKQGVAQLIQQLKELRTQDPEQHIRGNSYRDLVIAERQQTIRDELQNRYFSQEQQQKLNELAHQPIDKASSVPLEIQQARIDALQQTIANNGALKQWTYACDHQLSQYLNKLDIDPSALSYFESNAIQEQLIKENIQILNHAAENQSCFEARPYLDSAALTATNAINHIQAGNYVEAHALTDLAYALQEFAHGFAEQSTHATVQGAKSYGNLCLHPIESCRNIAKGIGHVLGIMLKEFAYLQTTRCGTDCRELTGWATQYKQEREALINALGDELQELFKDGASRGCGRLVGQVLVDWFIAPRFIGKVNKFAVNPLTRKTFDVLGKIATKTSGKMKPLFLNINIERATADQLSAMSKTFKKEFDQYATYVEKVAGKPVSKEQLLRSIGGVNNAVSEGVQAFDGAVEYAVNKGQALNQKTADKVIKKIPYYIQTQRLRIEKLEKYLATQLSKIQNPIFTKAKLKHIFGIDKLVKEFKSGKLGNAEYSGYHHDRGWKLMNEGKVKFKTEKIVYPNGVVYVEKVCVEGVELDVAKTFFPPEWYRQQVIDKIIEASQNIIWQAEKKGVRQAFKGQTKEGIIIKMVIDNGETLITAFPVLA